MATRRKTRANGKTRSRAIDVLKKTHDFVQREVDGWQAQLTDIKDVGTEMLQKPLKFEEVVTDVTALAVNFYDLTYGWVLRARDAYGASASRRGGKKSAKKGAKKSAKKRAKKSAA